MVLDKYNNNLIEENIFKSLMKKLRGNPPATTKPTPQPLETYLQAIRQVLNGAQKEYEKIVKELRHRILKRNLEVIQLNKPFRASVPPKIEPEKKVTAPSSSTLPSPSGPKDLPKNSVFTYDPPRKKRPLFESSPAEWHNLAHNLTSLLNTTQNKIFNIIEKMAQDFGHRPASYTFESLIVGLVRGRWPGINKKMARPFRELLKGFWNAKTVIGQWVDFFTRLEQQERDKKKP